jgi:hypothetical protein
MPTLRRRYLSSRRFNVRTSAVAPSLLTPKSERGRRISPELASIKRLMQRSSVDLPEPLKPMMPTNSPCSILTLTPRKTGVLL